MCLKCNTEKCDGDAEIEPGILPLVETFNRIPDVHTMGSCEGHVSAKGFSTLRLSRYGSVHAVGVRSRSPYLSFRYDEPEFIFDDIDGWRVERMKVKPQSNGYYFFFKPENNLLRFSYEVGRPKKGWRMINFPIRGCVSRRQYYYKIVPSNMQDLRSSKPVTEQDIEDIVYQQSQISSLSMEINDNYGKKEE